MATTTEMQLLPIEDLARHADELRVTIFNLRVKHRTGTLEKSSELKKHRKELAQVLTVHGQKIRAAKAAR